MGFKEWSENAVAAGKAAEAKQAEAKADKAASFEGIILRGGVVKYQNQGGPVKGAVARVEAGGDIGKRITATRLVALGVFALAAKKKSGHVFLTVESDGFEFAVEVPVKKEAEARKFAAKINTASKAAAR
jgi:hypothetical protein